MSIVSSVTTAITTPVWITFARMRASINRWLMCRGLRAMRSSAGESTPIASAGAESVIRLIHRSCVASSGSTTTSPAPS